MRIYSKLLCVCLIMFVSTSGSISNTAIKKANADPIISETPASITYGDKVSIRLESEPRLEAPIQTVVSSTPQTYGIYFPTTMIRSSVETSLQKQSLLSSRPMPPELAWTFNWDNDQLLHVTITLAAIHSTNYTLGDYQLNVNGSKTSKGNSITEAPTFRAVIVNPYQIWRYSLDGKNRELLDTIDEPYYFNKLENQDRYMLGQRYTDYCECDALYERLYAIYDLQMHQLIHYPMKLQTNYIGKGDFVVDRRGFFYEKPANGVEVPRSADAELVHVDGYVHGASISKDGKYLFMAIGAEDQVKDLTIIRYSLEDHSTVVLIKAVYGWVPEDQGYGRRMPVEFQDNGSSVYFVLNERNPYREVRYAYSWKDNKINAWDPPVSDNAWAGFSASEDNKYQYYANGGLYADGQKITVPKEIPGDLGSWIHNTHLLAFIKGYYNNNSNEMYTSNLQIFDADSMKQTTLYSGIYIESNLIGSSLDGRSLIVEARKPTSGSSLLPDNFGSADGKLLADLHSDFTNPIVLYMQPNKLKLIHQPLIIKEAIYIPLREVLVAAGWQISWQAEEQTITGKKLGRTDRTFKIMIDNEAGQFNSNQVGLPLAPKLINGTTYIYAGILQKLGMKLEWDDAKRIIFIADMPEAGGFTNSDGLRYEGGLRGNTPSGFGSLFTAEGKLIYEGEFADGKYQGQGKLYNEAGLLNYEGVFIQGQHQ